MRIAEVAPLQESVPPKLYGGTERVVSFLTEELVRQGHCVTLFASGDSRTHARLFPVCPRSLRLDPECEDYLPYCLVMLAEVLNRQKEFDVIHFHCGYLHFPLTRYARAANLTTLHGRLDLPDLRPLMRTFADVTLVSISNSQRTPHPQANWQGTVYHGLPQDLYHCNRDPGQYLAFIGRTSPEKGLDQAIEIAKRAGKKLKIAAKVDDVDREYFQNAIAPLLRHPLIEFIGEIGYPDKGTFLANASALLFPINWPEPFGLVMIEAMACGTPVIAYSRGSVPEIVESGISGFIVEGADSAVNAVNHLREIDRECCRRYFERRFTVERMASDYVGIYSRLLSEAQGLPCKATSFDQVRIADFTRPAP